MYSLLHTVVSVTYSDFERHSSGFSLVGDSVVNPDPDPYVFGPPGSGSGSITVVRDTELDPAPDPSIIKEK